MALLSISAAARAAGKDRGTIKRYLKDGRLSSTPDPQGNHRIDTSEIQRVFGALVADGSTEAPMKEYVPHKIIRRSTTKNLN